MKRKLIIVSLILVLGIIFWLIFRYLLFPEKGIEVSVAKNCKIYSNTGKSIPAKILKEAHFISKVKPSEESSSYILLFDDSLNFGNLEEKNFCPDVLFVMPAIKGFGASSLFRAGFRKIDEDKYYQALANPYGKDFQFFTALYNDPPIKFVSFDSNKVSFNTYGPLKQFGDTIIVEFEE